LDIITKAELREICKKYPIARKANENWMKIIENCHPKDHRELKQTFKRADRVGSKKDKTCFDIMNNNFRLIMEIDYEEQDVYILEFLTHAQYIRDYC
jgi:mRNA-degrading endonuclease HigB of HigAB toxin-antitoxin module